MHKGNLRFLEGFRGKTSFELVPDPLTTLILNCCAFGYRLRNAAVTALSGNWSHAIDLSSVMVNVPSPALAEQSFIDGIAQTAKADNVTSSSTC